MIINDKNIWRFILATASLESMTYICWLSNANPTLTKGMLSLTLATEIYVLPKAYSFFYDTYKNSYNIRDFMIQTKIPIASSFLEKYTKPDLGEALFSAFRQL